jgi:BirA family biotin operon repressor/biotin-[acetyl-CoA-carboxylase] ligase
LNIIELDTIDSTNSYAKKLIAEDKNIPETLIFSHNQVKGRGIGSNIWYTEDNKNLIFSIIKFPGIKIEDHFIMSMAVSLAICDYIHFKGIFPLIKWPNDIFINGKKVCGILIENSFYGDIIKSSIIGVGINLNQTFFPDILHNAVSISNVTKQQYDLKTEINIVSEIISEKINSLKVITFDDLKKEYLSVLLRYNELCKYKAGNVIFEGRIIDVKKSGHVVIEKITGELSEFYFKEIEYIFT